MGTMRLLLSVFLLGSFSPLFAEQSPSPVKSSWILAQGESTFDPFIDYGEFQDNVAEEESINFFQNGRSLTLSLFGGYEGLTLNMRQIYGDAPFLGASISFFMDLRFAFQMSGAFPTGHYNSLLNTTVQFSHLGIDLKYYFNRQYLSKDADFFNPYIIFGPFWLNIKHQIPRVPTIAPVEQNPGQIPGQNFLQEPVIPAQNPGQDPINPNPGSEERAALSSFNAAGLKIGVGIEFLLIQRSFMGVEISYLYTDLEFENRDLSQQTFPPLSRNPNQTFIEKLQYPNRPQLKGYRFFGDLVNAVVLFGVNF